MKFLMLVCITIGGLLGGWLSIKLDGGFGIWSVLFGGFIGPLIGLFVGYKAGKEWFE